MKKNKQSEQEQMKAIEIMVFKDIAECTEYFYNEYGKLKTVKEKLDSKKVYKKIRKMLENNFLANLFYISSRDNKVLQKERKELKNIVKEEHSQNKVEIIAPTETKLLTE